MYIITQNSALTATGVLLQAKIDDVNLVDFVVRDIGSATLTFESSTDNSSWSAMTTGVYTNVRGVLTPLGAATTTTKGTYYIDVSALIYVRVRVSTYSSGTVRALFEISTDTLFRIVSPMFTGLTAQGSTQATALPIQATFNQFATVAASSGAILPPGLAKAQVVAVRNDDGTNDLTVYPPVGYKINGGTVNVGATVAKSGTVTRFVSDGAGNFWTF